MAKGIAVGISKGHIVTKIEKPSWVKGTNRKLINIIIFSARKRVTVIRKVIAELVGRSPYEKKIIEILKLKQSNSNKKAYKVAKKRLGSHKRAIKKREELVELVNRRN